MVSIKYQGGLGNQMFQYAFARLMANKYRHYLNAESIPEFPNTTVHDIVDCNSDEIKLDGFFEQSIYYESHLKELREWFYREYKFNDPVPSIAIHIRGGGVRFNNSMGYAPANYYWQALERTGRNGAVIITNDPEWDFVKQFNLPVYCHEDRMEDFGCLLYSNTVIASYSTFCWWAAFLNENAKVIQPEPKTGWRSLKDTPNKYLGVPYWTKIEY